jgi:hypothetical protein
MPTCDCETRVEAYTARHACGGRVCRSDTYLGWGGRWLCREHGEVVYWLCPHEMGGMVNCCVHCSRNRMLCMHCDTLCGSCGCLIQNESDLSQCQYCDRRYCRDCGPRNRGGGRGCMSDQNWEGDRDCRVHNYHWRPPQFVPKTLEHETVGNGTILLGFELEVGGRADHIADAVYRLDTKGDHIYMVYDYSIHRGVEIISHPMTLGFARNYPFSGLLRNLRMAGCCVEDGYGTPDAQYGLHVHVTREAFISNAHRMRWLMFMYRNSDQLTQLARRSSERWAAFTRPVPGELKDKAERVQPLCDRRDRYYAVNCTNPETFELRFFKATLDETELYAALEFVDASVRYTRGLKAYDVLGDEALSWHRFTEWVRKSEYPSLSTVFQRRPAPGQPAWQPASTTTVGSLSRLFEWNENALITRLRLD